ncbi:MAG TPA: bifunctional transaldolase/phosoglucose isomerase [Nitrososphaerales archaeon]|nr:bifunctional transaldolase/phosoglucose isomerase [Nitrososphaerales archaeon]
MPQIQDFTKQGQSIWYDYLRRSFIESGELKGLIDEGLSGVTSNPTIFEKAIAGSTDYDSSLKRLIAENKTVREIYDALMIEDISNTADLFRPVYDSLVGKDGFVSIEVDPKLANDSEGMVVEAREFFKTLDRPNVMIKIPATEAGFPAIKALISEGINVNITLIFSQEQYYKTAEAYLSGLEELSKTKEDLSSVASVASFFVSRVDTAVDKALEKKGNKELQGKIGMANAKIAYSKFKEIFQGERWELLKSKGARIQRVLWASTGTKNPDYSDTLYVDNLIGPDTINTIPPATLKAALDHGKVTRSVESGTEEAKKNMYELSKVGVDFDSIAMELEDEGIEKFIQSIDSIFEKISQKRERFASEPYRESKLPEQYEALIDSSLNELSADNVVARIWKHDYTVWKSEPDEITNRLGWLDVADAMEESVHRLESLVDSVRASDYTTAVLLGMGGSSLAPETFAKSFGVKEGFFELLILDTTDPDTISSYVKALDLRKTLFVVSSKSGNTIETLTLFKFFYSLVSNTVGKKSSGEHFIAITDRGSQLEKIADEFDFRGKFLNDPNLGGRYSALSYFGLVPAALLGVEIPRLLDNALTMASACESCVHVRDNPGAWLGAVLGRFATSGRNKVTFIASPMVESLCDWIEQLLAESTGKEGKGIIPVVHEELGSPKVYGKDRLFIYLGDQRDESVDSELSSLEATGHPVVRLTIREPYEIGKQFFLWEFATAVAGHIIGINPFDQPNVEAAKSLAREIVASYVEKGTFQPEPPALTAESISLFGDVSAPNLADAIILFIENGKKNGSYITFQPYLQRTPETDSELDKIRILLRNRYKLATTLGYGPRYLHSTGQAHKGDSGLGLFLQFTAEHNQDIVVPDFQDGKVSFGVLEMASAMGDYKVLKEKGRHAIRLHLGKNIGKSLHYLERGLSELESKEEFAIK